MFNNVYTNAEEKYVKTTIVYAKEEDTYLYEDAKYTVKLDKETVRRIYLTGMTIDYKKSYYTPVSCKVDEGGTFASVTIWDVAESPEASLVLYSAEHS